MELTVGSVPYHGLQGTWISWFMHVSMHVCEYSCMCTCMFRYMCLCQCSCMSLNVPIFVVSIGVRMYVVYMCVQVCTRVCIHVLTSVCTHGHKYVLVHVWGYKSLCMYAYIYMCVHSCIHIYVHEQVCAWVCVCISEVRTHVSVYIHVCCIYASKCTVYVLYICIYTPMYVSIGVCMCELGVCLGLLTFYPCVYVMWNPPLHAMNTIG